MTSKCCRGSEYSYGLTTTCTECKRHRLNTRICASKLFLLGVQFFLTGSVSPRFLNCIATRRSIVAKARLRWADGWLYSEESSVTYNVVLSDLESIRCTCSQCSY